MGHSLGHKYPEQNTNELLDRILARPYDMFSTELWFGLLDKIPAYPYDMFATGIVEWVNYQYHYIQFSVGSYAPEGDLQLQVQVSFFASRGISFGNKR
jgi:hypothetical protein